MTVKILVIGDAANVITNIKSSLKKTIFHIIDFPKISGPELIVDSDKEFFQSYNVRKNLKKLNKIKNQYDLCVTTSWAASALAYLAGLNYIIYFIGTDIREPPFAKEIETFYCKKKLSEYNFFERNFFKKVFDEAIGHVTSFEEKFSNLEKYSKNPIRIDNISLDSSKFNLDVKPINLAKKKFTFFSPSRIDLVKGSDILWKAIDLTKEDFVILQVNWFGKNSVENDSKNEIFSKKPKKLEYIPLINREDIAKYYSFADAIISSIGLDYPEGVAIEGTLCGKPVISYSNRNTKYLLDQKEMISPFLPNSKNPCDLASLMDHIVSSKDFRMELAKKENEFIQALTNFDETGKRWDDLFEEFNKKYPKISKGISKFSLNRRLVILGLGKLFKIIYKK